MTLQDDSEPWKRDDALVAVLAVEWIAKNVFLVTIPAYRRKVSCELTAVDVPRGTSLAISEKISAVLERVNSAMRVYLRQDFYSNFPLEGYGDIIFSAEARQDTTYQLHWCSLQETLVRVGVACVVRPSVIRQAPLLEAEEAHAGEGEDEHDTPSWLRELQRRERGPLFCMERRCVVEDVMRGDAYRVSWQPEDLSGTEGGKPSLPLPPLLILDSTVCHSVSTQPGFAALRWAQLHLLHRELTVKVHAVYPSDRDVAFNTQLETYEHLANVRATASVADWDGEPTDVGVALVTLGLGWVRRVADAGVPRASNLFAVFRAIAAVASTTLPVGANAAKGSNTAPEADAMTCSILGKAWGIPASAAAGLLRFHDDWWRQVCWTSCQLCASQPRGPARVDGVGATAEVWNRTMWCADLHKDPNDEPRVYVHRPLRTLFPLAGLAEGRVRLQGHVDGAVVVRTDDGRCLLQVEVAALTSAAEWCELRRAFGYADLDAVRFSPTPGDSVLGKKVNVTIAASSFGASVETRLRVCCTSYAARTFLLAQHTPSEAWSVKEGGWCEEVLSVEGTAKEERVFVLDVMVEARDGDSMTWSQRGTGRAIYLLSPNVDADPAEATERDDRGKDANAAAPGPSSADQSKGSAALLPLLRYQSHVSFFFELNASLLVGGGDRGDDAESLLPQLRRSFLELMYEDVVALPVGVAEVCGVRGLVGDLFFPNASPPRRGGSLLRARAPCVFARSLLSLIGRTWWPCLSSTSAVDTRDAPWPMSTAVYDAVQESFDMCLERVEEEEWTARQAFLKEVSWRYQVLDQEARNTFPLYQPQTPFKMNEGTPPARTALKRSLCFSAGHVDLWRDGAARVPRLRLPPSILPPTVPLSLFAVRPREVFSVASTQKMKTMAARKAAAPPKTLQEESYDQQDWAFMRLHLPFLPNVLHCDWERLPVSLRNTERALCEAIVRDGSSVVREPGMLYSTDRIFSTFLSYLALLQSMQTTGRAGSGATGSAADPLSSSSPSSASALASVYQAFQQSTPSFWADCSSTLHFSATLFVLPSYRVEAGAKPIPHSRPLFLGSRDNIVSDAFEVPRRDNATPEIVSYPLLRDLTMQCVSAVGAEAFVETVDEAGTAPSVVNLDDGRRPDQLRLISNQGLPWDFARAGTPVLYHPLPRMAVLASPLVERDEYTAEALGRLELDHDSFAGVKAERRDTAMVRRRVALQYRCVTKFNDKNPYNTISYGRVSSVDMFKTLISDRARGKEVQAYMSLLLRRNVDASDGTGRAVKGSSADWPDGLLTFHGVPAEPLYVHYRSRADLRFTLSTICPPLRQALLHAERGTGARVEDAEADLLTLYAEAAATFVRTIYERVRRNQPSADAAEQISLVFTLQPWDDGIEPYIAIQVFPVYPSDGEAMDRVLDQESMWPQGHTHRDNPHKAFSLLGSRFGRLAMAELRIHYDAAENRFTSSWNDMFE